MFKCVRLLFLHRVPWQEVAAEILNSDEKSRQNEKPFQIGMWSFWQMCRSVFRCFHSCSPTASGGRHAIMGPPLACRRACRWPKRAGCLWTKMCTLMRNGIPVTLQRRPLYIATGSPLRCNGVPVVLQRHLRYTATRPSLCSNDASVAL